MIRMSSLLWFGALWARRKVIKVAFMRLQVYKSLQHLDAHHTSQRILLLAKVWNISSITLKASPGLALRRNTPI